MTQVLEGNAKTVEATFSEAPTAVRLTVRRPDGTTSQPSLTTVSPTVRAHTLVLDTPGVWWFYWDADGPDVAFEHAILVTPSKVV